MFNEVFLDDVFVPDDCVVGEVNDGWKLARTTLANERVAMAGRKLGLSTERAIELLAGRSRRPMPRGSAGRSRWRRCATCSASARPCGRSPAGAPARSRASRSCWASATVRRHPTSWSTCSGPAALFASDDPALAADVHEMLLTRCLSIAGGTTQVLRNVVAERVLGLPRG